MSFFSGLSGVRFPEVVMNKGPLPGTGGLPTPLHDTPDGRINHNSSLLGDLEPYAYGEPGYLSSQSSYLNIPHKIQKIVPFLFLPNPDGTDLFRLNHSVDDCDIAFTMRLDRNSEFCNGLSNRNVQLSGLGTAIDPMINLCTLNYLLAGMQICTELPNLREQWDKLLRQLDKFFPGDATRHYNFADLKRVVRHLIRPFGIAHGSEKQGGQHEGSHSAGTWPVSFVVSLTLDGKDANVLNIWSNHDVEAGSDLVLRLKPVPIPPGGKYTLDHWGKSLVDKTFTPNTMRGPNDRHAPRRITHVWQLVPRRHLFAGLRDEWEGRGGGHSRGDERARPRLRASGARSLLLAGGGVLAHCQGAGALAQVRAGRVLLQQHGQQVADASACSRSITFRELVEYEDFDQKMCSFAGLGEMAVYLV